MEKYIGIDVHPESCTIAVMNSAGRHNRPFVRRWLGQRADLTLTNAPLGEAIVPSTGRVVALEN